MQSIELSKQMSERELGMLGMADIAYVKPVVVDGAEIFAVHAADGTQVALVAERNLAFAVVRQNGLEPVSVH